MEETLIYLSKKDLIKIDELVQFLNSKKIVEPYDILISLVEKGILKCGGLYDYKYSTNEFIVDKDKLYKWQ